MAHPTPPSKSSSKPGTSAPKEMVIRQSPKTEHKPAPTLAPSASSKISKKSKAEMPKPKLVKRKTGVKPSEGKERGYEADTEWEN
ncbi:hypothetical protein EAF00_005429 [Botryotinia globosa]|nr:hypothetical protein EAF00_005429 [Botryotinia globosa]